jgi:hypothetical protein
MRVGGGATEGRVSESSTDRRPRLRKLGLIAAILAVCLVSVAVLHFVVYTNHYHEAIVTPGEVESIVEAYTEGHRGPYPHFLTATAHPRDGMVMFRRNPGASAYTVILTGSETPIPSTAARTRFRDAFARENLTPTIRLPAHIEFSVPDSAEASASLARVLRETLAAEQEYGWRMTWSMTMPPPPGIDADLVGILGGLLD